MWLGARVLVVSPMSAVGAVMAKRERRSAAPVSRKSISSVLLVSIIVCGFFWRLRYRRGSVQCSQVAEERRKVKGNQRPDAANSRSATRLLFHGVRLAGGIHETGAPRERRKAQGT